MTFKHNVGEPFAHQLPVSFPFPLRFKGILSPAPKVSPTPLSKGAVVILYSIQIAKTTYLPSPWQILTSTSVTTVNHPWPLFELSFSKSKCKNSLPLILSSVAESLFIGHMPLLFLHAVSLQTYWSLTELIGHTFPWR